jgi:hypothetical protein
MKINAVLALAALVLLAWATPGTASVPAQMYCWSEDSEFPVPCDPDDDDDGGEPRLGSTRRLAGQWSNRDVGGEGADPR